MKKLLILFLLVNLACSQKQTLTEDKENEERKYWPVPPSKMSTNFHTHVSVEGKITQIHREGDGDIHIRIVDKSGFIIAECMPELPCHPPKIGTCVIIKGISRFDGEHKWWEVHPVESIQSCN